jgi:hypothetical protein
MEIMSLAGLLDGLDSSLEESRNEQHENHCRLLCIFENKVMRKGRIVARRLTFHEEHFNTLAFIRML